MELHIKSEHIYPDTLAHHQRFPHCYDAKGRPAYSDLSVVIETTLSFRLGESVPTVLRSTQLVHPQLLYKYKDRVERDAAVACFRSWVEQQQGEPGGGALRRVLHLPDGEGGIGTELGPAMTPTPAASEGE